MNNKYSLVIIKVVILGWIHSFSCFICSGPVLSWYYDILGSGIWSAMDSSIFLFHLDLSLASTVHGNQVIYFFIPFKNVVMFRKLKPHRMLWFVVSSIVHIILAAILLVLYTLLPPSIPPG